MSRKPADTAIKYIYCRRYNSWVIYKIEYTANRSNGTWIKSYNEEEDARREVYRLNGWQNYKPKKTTL